MTFDLFDSSMVAGRDCTTLLFAAGYDDWRVSAAASECDQTDFIRRRRAGGGIKLLRAGK